MTLTYTAQVTLSSFHAPRKVYHGTKECSWIEVLHGQGYLRAGDLGEDEHGNYQMFSLTEKGREFIDS